MGGLIGLAALGRLNRGLTWHLREADNLTVGKGLDHTSNKHFNPLTSARFREYFVQPIGDDGAIVQLYPVPVSRL